MDPRLAFFAAFAVVLAGCAAPPPETGTPPGTDQAPTAPVPPPATVDGKPVQKPLYAPLCGLASGPSWNEACLAFSSPNDSPSKTEIDIIVNPLDPLNVIVASKDLDPLASDCVWSVAQVTKDGGETWATSYVGGTMPQRMAGDPLFGWKCVTDPILSWGADGTAYYALQAYDNAQGDAAPALPVIGDTSQGSAFFLAVSTDGGITWPSVLPMHVGDGTAVFHDYPRMLTNPATGSVFAVWNQISIAVAEPVIVGTRNGGETVDPPTYVPSPENGPTLGMTGFAAGNDAIYLAMQGGIMSAAPGAIWMSSSTDDARTFTPPVEVSHITPISCPLANSEFRCFSAFEIAADASGGERDGRLYAAWADASVDTSDIFSAHSEDGGMTWSEPVRVNDDSTTNDQFMVRATVGGDGVVHAVFYDRRYDPGNKLIDVTYAFSEDGGETWTNQRLTTRSFDGDLGIHQGGFPFIGDYIGIAASGDHVYAGFPTTHTGRAEIAVAHIVKQG